MKILKYYDLTIITDYFDEEEFYNIREKTKQESNIILENLINLIKTNKIKFL
jgi:hypothetical protein